MRFSLDFALFPLDGSAWLRCDVPKDAVDAWDGLDEFFYYFITGAAMLLTLTAASECAFT